MNKHKEIKRLDHQTVLGILNQHMSSRFRNEVEAFETHWHNYFEIDIFLNGAGKYIHNGTEYEVKKGRAFIMSPVDFHMGNFTEKTGFLNISFDAECMSNTILAFLSNPNLKRVYDFSEEECKRLAAVTELLRYECENEGPCKIQLLEYVLSFFMKKFMNNDAQVADMTGIQRAISYIEMHFREKISLELLSEISGYTRTYFSELFKKVTGETYIDRLKFLRVKYACMLLSNGVSVTDACHESGFSSVSNFLAAFKAHCNMTPSEYRKMSKQGEKSIKELPTYATWVNINNVYDK